MNMRAFSTVLLLTLPVSLTLAENQRANSAPVGPASIAAPAGSPPSKSLYDRLGGAYPIAVVIDDFIERLLVDDTLNSNPAIKEARQRVPAQGLKFHVTTLVCQVTGGPCKYAGRDMRSSHVHLHISEREWQAMLTDFNKTLEKFRVPAAEKGELVAIVNSTKSEIVANEAQ